MKRHPINILKKISMILFDNKTKIKWEWNNIIKRKIKNKTEIQSLTKQTAKDDLKEKLKKTKKLTQVSRSNTRPTYEGKITPNKKLNKKIEVNS